MMTTMSTMTEHRYRLHVVWQGNRGSGTSGYRDYDRDTVVTASGKPDLLGSADRAFHGDATRWNPEDLLVAALSQCHLLSYLHVAAAHGIVVTDYRDDAEGRMEQEGIGGRFTEVVLRPVVTITDPARVDEARSRHADAAAACFIAASVSFPVRHEPTIRVG